MVRTTVYVDGFNLYGGALKGATGYRWLDLFAIAKQVLQRHHQIDAIHYYTALVRSDGNNDLGPQHQKLYIKALETHIPCLTTHYGHFTIHKAKARPTNPGALVEYQKIEEKGSDVNLASHVVADAFLDRYECAVLVTNDGDMAEAIRTVKTHTGKMVGVILPLSHPARWRRKRRASHQLLQSSDFQRELRPATIRKCQLPDPIPSSNLHKPPNW